MINTIKRALQGYHGELKERIHYSEWIRRMAPSWLSEYVREHDYVVAQLKRIEGCVVPGLANHIAAETLKHIGDGAYGLVSDTGSTNRIS